MKKLFVFALILSFAYHLNASFDANDKLKIHFHSEVNSSLTVKLAYYYGSRVFLQDSISLETSGKLAYTGDFHKGIYLLVFPNSKVYEFMVNENNELSISISSGKNGYSASIRGDSISKAFDIYSKKMIGILDHLDSLKHALSITKSDIVSSKIKKNIKTVKDSLQLVNEVLSIKYHGTFLGNYLHAQIPVSMPKLMEKGISSDSLGLLMKLYYYKNHYLDNINWSDQRLIYTPVMEKKIKEYFIKFVQKKPDSITEAIDTIINKTNNQEVYRFLTEMLFDKYEQNKHKSLDEYAYLHLVKQYYLGGKTPWMNDEQISILEDEYNRIWPASIGQVAPSISLPDKDDQIVHLNNIRSAYTLVFFWDYECTHCKRILQELVSLESKYRYLDIKVMSVFTGEDMDVWKAYLAKKIPQAWENTYQKGQEIKPISVYNVNSIPSIYLLDANKVILNKNVTVSELDGYFFDHSKDEGILND
jgi:thiol-disulfide isomerase/thioredoxin